MSGELDLQERNSVVRLSRRLVGLHLAGVAILFFVVLSSVIWISAEHNKLAIESSQSMVRSGIASFQQRLRTLVRDYSIWDEAYQALQQGDRRWLYRNIGNAAREIGTLDLITFVSPTGEELFSWERGSPIDGDSDLLPPDLLASIVGMLGDASLDDSAPTLLASFNGEPWGFAVARVTPLDGPPAGMTVADLPMQIHGFRLAGPRLAQIGGNLLINDLELEAIPGPSDAFVTLIDYRGQEIGNVAWVPTRPGASILRQVALPLGLALVVIAIVTLVSSRYTVRSARRLERALVAAKAADKSKTEFLSNVSHELRTPMNGILGVAQLLQTTNLDAEQQELLGVLFTSANAQMALISDLLDFSRMESGNRQIVREPFEPSQILRDLTEMIRIAVDKKSIAFDSDWQALTGLTVLGDAQAFRQVVTNLLGNAVKFTDRGRIVLASRVALRDGRAHIVVEVRDTGRGIPPEAMEHIFERFYQVDSSLTRSTEGTGLGLAISQGLARMMGGRIEAESVVGRGSTFAFSASFALAEKARDERDAA